MQGFQKKVRKKTKHSNKEQFVSIFLQKNILKFWTKTSKSFLKGLKKWSILDKDLCISWTIPICKIFPYQVMTVTLHLFKKILKYLKFFLIERLLNKSDSLLLKQHWSFQEVISLNAWYVLFEVVQNHQCWKTALITKLCLCFKYQKTN